MKIVVGAHVLVDPVRLERRHLGPERPTESEPVEGGRSSREILGEAFQPTGRAIVE